MIGNPNAYALQQEWGGYEPKMFRLSVPVLLAHLRQEFTVGTYVNDGDKARTLVFDIDEWDLDKVNAIRKAAQEIGLPDRASCLEFSGSKGHHIWYVVSTYVPARQLRLIGRAVLTLAGVDCEIFPKQDNAPNLGNLVKLPFGIHQKTGNPNPVVEGWPQPMSAAVIARIASTIPETTLGAGGGDPIPVGDCVGKIQEDAERGNRNIGLLQVAVLARKAGLVGPSLGAAVGAVNQGFTPPLSDSELARILTNSENIGPVCTQLPESLRCDSCPIYRDRGLSTRQGQLKYAGEGELVVVQVSKRRPDGQVEIEHPDLVHGVLKVRS